MADIAARTQGPPARARWAALWLVVFAVVLSACTGSGSPPDWAHQVVGAVPGLRFVEVTADDEVVYAFDGDGMAAARTFAAGRSDAQLFTTHLQSFVRVVSGGSVFGVHWVPATDPLQGTPTRWHVFVTKEPTPTGRPVPSWAAEVMGSPRGLFPIEVSDRSVVYRFYGSAWDFDRSIPERFPRADLKRIHLQLGGMVPFPTYLVGFIATPIGDPYQYGIPAVWTVQVSREPIPSSTSRP